MIVLSDAAAAAALDAIGRVMDGGVSKLLIGNGGVPAPLRLSDPAAACGRRRAGVNEIAEGDAFVTGQATSARAHRRRVRFASGVQAS